MAEQKHYPVQKVSFVYVLPDLQQLLVVFASMVHTSYASCTVECVPTPNVERQLIPGRSVVGGNGLTEDVPNVLYWITVRRVGWPL